MSDGIEIAWLGGNCPVQAEGTADGEPLYFRARGSSVSCDIGNWVWYGPEYEWPGAGWISEDLARAYILEAYEAWKRRDEGTAKARARCRRRNGLRMEMMAAIRWAGMLRRELGDEAKPAHDWLMAYAAQMVKRSEATDET